MFGRLKQADFVLQVSTMFKMAIDDKISCENSRPILESFNSTTDMRKNYYYRVGRAEGQLSYLKLLCDGVDLYREVLEVLPPRYRNYLMTSAVHGGN